MKQDMQRKQNQFQHAKWVVLLAALSATCGIWAVVAQLDPGFGGQGHILNLVPGPTRIRVSYLAAQSGGRFIAAGDVISRFSALGARDLTFGNEGTVEFDYSVRDVEVIDGDTFYVLGVDSGTQTERTVLARFLADGTPDSSCGNNGLAALTLSAEDRESPVDLLVHTDGSLIVSGCDLDGFDGRTFFAGRIRSNGTVDTSFGTNGIIRDEGLLIGAIRLEGDFSDLLFSDDFE